MDGNQKFWLSIWTVVLVFFVALAAVIASVIEIGHQKEVNALTAMVEAGADPVRATCALEVRSGIKTSIRQALCLTQLGPDGRP